MSDISQRIKNISQFFKGMKVDAVDEQQIIYVIVAFPDRWIIDSEIQDKFNVSVARGNDYPGQYYFCAEMEVGFDTIFDAIDYNINKMRLALERASLLAQKVEELKELFANENIAIESLRNLEFTYKMPKKSGRPKSKPTESENKEENISE